MEIMEIIQIIAFIGVGIVFIAISGIAILVTLKRIMKNGGIDVMKIIGMGRDIMKQKNMKKQLEEIEEPNQDEIEVADSEEETEQPEEKPSPAKTICMVIVEGGKAYRGEFLGEDAQFVSLPTADGTPKLVKQDSVWVKIKTEKTPLLVINKRHIILMAFENIPQVQPAKQKPVAKKQQDEADAEDAISGIDV